MKPLKLTIEGVKSFREKQTVDFCVLGKNNIFVISGVTGAGKTTVLDCIIIALYGGMKRDGLKSEEYVNLREDKAVVTLEFSAEKGGEERQYFVTRTLYKGNRSAKATLSDMRTGIVIAEGADKVNAEIESIIGLGYDDFTKVVILQQGRYNEFLKSTKAKRTELVGSLFKLDKYRGLFAKAKSRRERLDEQIAALDEYLEGKKELTALSLKENKKKLKLLSEGRGQAEKAIEGLKKVQQEIMRQAQSYAEYERALSLRKAAQEGFDKALGAVKELEKADIQKDKDRLTELTEQCALAAQRKADIEKAKPLKEQLDEAVKQREEKRGKFKAARDNYNGYKVKEESAAEEAERQREIVSVNIASVADEKIVKISGDMDAAMAERLLGEVKRKADAVKSADSLLARAIESEEKKRLALEKAEAALTELKAKKEKAERDYESAEKVAASAEEELERQKTEEVTAAIAATLKENDTCPVCGGVFRGRKSHESADIAKAEEEKKKAQAKLVGAREALDSIRQKYATCEKEAEMTRAAHAESREAVKENRTAADKLERPQLATFDEITATLQTVAAALKLKEKAEKDAADYHALTEKEKAVMDGLEGEGKTLGVSIAGLEKQLSLILHGEDYAAAHASATEKEKSLVKEKEELARKIQQAESSLRAARERLSSAEGALKTSSEAAEKGKCEKPSEQMQAENEQKLAAEESALREILTMAAALEARVQSDEKELEIKREKEVKKKAATEKRDNLRLLEKMLKGDAFLEFVAQEYIDDFSRDASKILAGMSSGCYTMGYSADKAEFFVCDFRAGNLQRSTSTLSGGETFLASLSLAIAVSKSIAAKNTSGLKFDFLFLDEGFGTLHVDAIGIVERALRKLAKETLVGLVTHRSELCELIPDRLTVEGATEQEGSKVTISN